MKRPRFADVPASHHRPTRRWRGGIDWLLGALVVAAWTVVAIDADRALRSTQSAIEARAAEVQ